MYLVFSFTLSEHNVVQLTIKLSNYLASGTLVWIVRPEQKYIEVHQSGKPTKVVTANGILEDGEVLPNLSIKVSDILK